MSKAPGRGQGCALLVAADFQKEFWLHVTFILIACAFTIFDKIILIAFLSGRPVLTGSCADYMSEQVVKIELKFF